MSSFGWDRGKRRGEELGLSSSAAAERDGKNTYDGGESRWFRHSCQLDIIEGGDPRSLCPRLES